MRLGRVRGRRRPRSVTTLIRTNPGRLTRPESVNNYVPHLADALVTRLRSPPRSRPSPPTGTALNKPTPPGCSCPARQQEAGIDETHETTRLSCDRPGEREPDRPRTPVPGGGADTVRGGLGPAHVHAGGDHQRQGAGRSQTGYDQWLGIPYAADPTGSSRWTAPRPAARWTGVRDATGSATAAPRPVAGTPATRTRRSPRTVSPSTSTCPKARRAALPVLVWIHGGGFTGGAGQDTNPRKFVAADERGRRHRQLPPGRRSDTSTCPSCGRRTPTAPAPSGCSTSRRPCAGYRPTSATSAVTRGTSPSPASPPAVRSVCAQLASPTAKGLFSRAVIMSGGCSLQSTGAGETSSLAFVKEVGCSTASDVLACLRGKPAADIVTAQQKAGIRPSLGGAAFPADPAVAVPAGKFNRVPVMLGQVSSERSLSTFQNYDYLGKPLTAAAVRGTGEVDVRHRRGPGPRRVSRHRVRLPRRGVDHRAERLAPRTPVSRSWDSWRGMCPRTPTSSPRATPRSSRPST